MGIVRYPKLEEELMRQGKTHLQLARELGISRQALRRKLHGGDDFSGSEICKVSRYLKAPAQRLFREVKP